MKHLVVFEVVHQGVWHCVGVRYGIHRSSPSARQATAAGRLQERRQLGVSLRDARHQQFASASPARHHGEQRKAEHQREPAAFHELERAGNHQHQVDCKENETLRPLPRE